MLASKNIFWLSVSRVFSLVLLFVAYASLFRYLGPENSGKYQFILSYVLMFAIISDFGIQQFITKKISENPAQKKEYFQEFLRFELFLCILLFSSLLGLAYFRGFESNILYGIAIAGLGMCLNTMCYPFLAVMSAEQDLKKVALINFVNSLVNVSIIFLAIYFKQGIVFLSSVQLVFGVIDLILYRIFIKKHLPFLEVSQIFKSFSFKTVKSILKNGWPFVLLVGFSAVYNRIDVIILAKFLDYIQVGFYTAAYKFFDLLSFFPAVVSHTLFPVFAASMSKGLMPKVREDLEKFLRLMLALALPLAVGGCILAKPLIVLVAGNEFEPGARVLSVIIWAIAILFIYIPLNSLIISQLTKKAALITGINVLVNIIGNIILIPKFGILAAAIMTVVSELIQGIFYFIFVKSKITDFVFFAFAIKPLAASLIMGAVIWQVRDLNVLISLTTGAIVYLIILLISGFLKKDDFLFVRQLFQQS